EELEARLAATDGTDARPQLPPVAEQAIAQFWSLAVDALCEVEPSDPEIALAVDGAPEAVIARLAGLSQVRGCRDLSSGAASLPEPLSSADASPQAASDLLICTSPAPDLLRAREQLSEGGEIVIAVPPMFGSVFAEEDAVAQAATALGEAGFETVCTGWFDTGSCVLGLVSGRVPAVAERSGFAALGMTADEAPETCAAVILLHDDGQEAAAAEAAARLGGAVTAPITAAPPLGGSDVFVFPAQGSGKATIRDCVATRLELARSAAFVGNEHTTEFPRRLAFLARDASGRRAVDDDLGEEVAGAALSGLVRTLANEVPKLRVSLVQSDDPVTAILALRTVPPPGDERILAYEEGVWGAPRVVRRSLEPERGARRLEAQRPGAIDSLHWAAADLPSPGPGEVLLRVEAAGLNFRDVMWAQRRLPAEALELGRAGATLGMECVGRVVALGPGIAEDTAGGAGSLAPHGLETPIGGAIAVGDRVLALGSGALATHLTVDSRLVVRLPDGLSVPSAAGLAVTGITARYALEDLAQLASGETLLLHGGAGGVGLAALAFARARGAKVIASASTPSRRRLLEALGAAATIDSRSPDFADRVRALTDGRGCDVVLNSLAGEAQRRSLGCLAPFGRFVELGKRDIYENAQLPLREFARNLSFFAFDADQLLASKPERVVALLEEVVADCASGRLPLLPVRVIPADATEEGFRLMQRAGHIGKIVLIPPDLGEIDVGPAVAPPAGTRQAPASEPGEETAGSNTLGATSARLEGAGDWLIVGGAGGLGRAIAVHLARRGAGRLWIVGRRASRADAAKEWELARAAGATPLLRDVDASDREAMDALAAEIAAAPRAPGAPMLEGVIHAAMVLDDAPLTATTPERAEPVLRAKIDTALSLHAATVPLAPGRFVVLGSIAARLGNPGQAAYSTANAALEGLVRARRRAGLPGVALALGPVSDAGYLADDREQATKIAKTLEDLAGTRPLRVEEVLSALDAVLDDPAPPVSVSVMPEGAALDPNALPIARSPMMSRLARPPSKIPEQDASNSVDAASIAALPIAEALKALEAAVRAALSRILRLPVAEIPTNRPLGDLGLDSLMALDLKNTLEERHGFAVPVIAVGAETTISSLAAMLCNGIPQAGGVRSWSDREPPIDSMTILHDVPSEGSAHSSPSEGGASRPEGTITEDTNLAGALSAAHAAGLPSAM
ncbi:MAG: SDR family NAD(P)-dependent oxidoreductase, partial [Pseudomonadota bacterium]